MSRAVIVGAGHAGGSAAALLRQYGFEGEIVLIGEEPIAPYQRPPLSKAWLKGEADSESLLLRPVEFYAEHAIDWRPNQRVTGLDRHRKVVRLQDGAELAYDALILATGSQAHKLPIPGADDPRVLELRTAADADRLKAVLQPGRRLIIVGAGYVGLEVAASARALGCEAVVLEREARVLARVASQPLSRFFEDFHRARGVDIRTGAEAAAVVDARGVTLKDGSALEGDAVLVGVGARACDELALEAGLACNGGIVVDDEARTADRAIYAIGDCTHRPWPLYGASGRLESVPNALEQAKQAAASIAGHAPPAPEAPWFWSDQYELKLQIAGLPVGVDRLIVRGDPANASFAVFHLSGDVIRAVEAVNAAPEFMAGRMFILQRRPVDATKLADPAVSMKLVGAA